MADKRIYELATTTVKTGKFLALDSVSLTDAEKFAADDLFSEAEADLLYVSLTANESIFGNKTFRDVMFMNMAEPKFSMHSTAGASIVLESTAAGIGTISLQNAGSPVGWITRDGANLIFQDTLTGPHTLSDLISPPVSPSPWILDANGIIYGAAPAAVGHVGIGAGSSSILPLYVFQPVGGNDLAEFSQYAGTTANYARISINPLSAIVDSHVAFLSASVTKWSIGNAAVDHSFRVRSGFGPFASTDQFMLSINGDAGFGTITPGIYNAGGGSKNFTFADESGVPATYPVINLVGRADTSTTGAISFYNLGTSDPNKEIGRIFVAKGFGGPKSGIFHVFLRDAADANVKMYFSVYDDGRIWMPHLQSATKSDVVYWDPVDGVIYHGAAPAASPWISGSFGINYGVSPAGNVGIGVVANVATTLSVFQNISGNTDIAIFSQNSPTTATTARISINPSVATVHAQLALMSAGSTKWSVGNHPTNDEFHISPGFGPHTTLDPFQINQAGFVAIGATPDPLHKLFVTNNTVNTARFDLNNTSVYSPTAINTAALQVRNYSTPTATNKETLIQMLVHSETSGSANASVFLRAYQATSHTNGGSFAITLREVAGTYITPLYIRETGAVTITGAAGTNDSLTVWGDMPFVAWNDNATTIPNRTIWARRVLSTTPDTTGDYTTMALHSKGASGMNAYVFLACESDSNTNQGAIFNVALRGGGTSEYFTHLKIHHDGEMWFPRITTSAEAVTLRYTAGGTPAGLVSYPSSDLALKENVVEWTADALTVLTQFVPKSFTWKDGQKEAVGWIAQEGVQFIPSMFPKHHRTKLFMLGESEILPYFHKAITQLLDRIETLENQQ